VLKALAGLFVRSLMTRSKRPVTGVMDSTVGMRLIWLMALVIPRLQLANIQLVDSFFDIFLTGHDSNKR